MINILRFRKKKFLRNAVFKSENELNIHIEKIKLEDKKIEKISRMRELENWLKNLDLE